MSANLTQNMSNKEALHAHEQDDCDENDQVDHPGWFTVVLLHHFTEYPMFKMPLWNLLTI